MLLRQGKLPFSIEVWCTFTAKRIPEQVRDSLEAHIGVFIRTDNDRRQKQVFLGPVGAATIQQRVTATIPEIHSEGEGIANRRHISKLGDKIVDTTEVSPRVSPSGQ